MNYFPPSSKLKRYTVEVWEWISTIFPHFVIDAFTYPCCRVKLMPLEDKIAEFSQETDCLLMI